MVKYKENETIYLIQADVGFWCRLHIQTKERCVKETSYGINIWMSVLFFLIIQNSVKVIVFLWVKTEVNKRGGLAFTGSYNFMDFYYLFFIELWLNYSVVFHYCFTAEWCSYIHIYTHTFFFIFIFLMVYHRRLNIVPFAI